ncbi:MAG: short-chain dehydrogenase/reductase [Flavipsychrobacter sp.]|nr:short-chain dehydrogenase/reductase [Flavipsychrobacter sp.]
MPNAIITGATQGIGKAIAEKLLSEGYAIAICSRNNDNLKAAAAAWNEQYPTASIITYSADLSNKEEAGAFGDVVLSNFDTIDLLVNNAGMYLPGTIADEPDTLLETMIGTNLYSAYHLTRKILPAMKRQKAGHIFNICSIASLRAYPNGGSYSISKYALLGFSDNLREELKEYNIKVTAICPGATYTLSWEGSDVPPERIMEAGDVAEMLWSASKLSPQANVEQIVMRPVKGDL